MEVLQSKLKVVESVLNRYAMKLESSPPGLLYACTIALRRCYLGENYKNSIRLGKQILDNHMIWESFNGE